MVLEIKEIVVNGTDTYYGVFEDGDIVYNDGNLPIDMTRDWRIVDQDPDVAANRLNAIEKWRTDAAAIQAIDDSFIGATVEVNDFTYIPPDLLPPVITLLGANPQTINVGSPYVELGATAVDDVDGDVTDQIVIDASTVNTGAVDEYFVFYDVKDSAGNAADQAIRVINVVDPGE